jgi:hypothetical protein
MRVLNASAVLGNETISSNYRAIIKIYADPWWMGRHKILATTTATSYILIIRLDHQMLLQNRKEHPIDTINETDLSVSRS